MRQDVKLGLAIGGILLAVLIVYVLVVPGDNGAADVQLVGADGNPVTDTTGATTTPDANTLDLTQPAPIPPVETARTETPAETATDPFGSGDTVASSDPAPVADNRTDGANHDWAELLSGQAQLPALMTETPTNANRVAAIAPQPAAAVAAAPETSVASDGPIAPVTPSVIDPGANAISETQQAAPQAVATTHVVQAGETLSSISAKFYGSPNYYPHIVRANPQINPNRLKVGTTIQIPASSEVRPAAQQDQAITASASFDPASQYKVGAGDSLYTISVKLYGKANRVDSLYQANKEKIGPDPAKLKAGTVLVLPEPPSVAAR